MAIENTELIHKIKNIQLKAKYLVTNVLVGQYESAFKGQGIEFSEVREYIPGDDIRTIDWNVTARMNVPYIKEFIEERELTIIILVDLSSSLYFGTKNLKKDIATEISAILSYLALLNNDKVGLIAFTDKIEKYVPPKKGRNHVWRIIREILTFEPENKHTNLSVALDFLMNVTKKKAIVFLLSDFLDENYEKSIKNVSSKHDFITVRITDPKEYPQEQDFENLGIITFEDAETGEIIELNSNNKKDMKLFRELASLENESFNKFIKLNKTDYVEISTDTEKKPYIKDLVKFFKLREKRLK